MPLRLHNTASGKKEDFHPLGGEVKMYTCGPTVYNVAHIGNLSSFLAADVLRRWLVASGHAVRHVMNITDVDDKTIRGAREAGLPLAEFTAKYEALFRDDLRRLNVLEPTFVHATKNIEAMVADIQTLLAKGLAYEKDGSVYFAIQKFSGYGALAGLEKRVSAPAQHRVDVDDYDKDAAEDFVLWKGWKEEDGEVYWETPLGRGRPGWHIECSAMIRRHLGDQIDIHTGAADLVFPHHTNEIAQAEGVTGKQPFVRYWFHRGFLTVDNEKMAKRVGNVLALTDVAANELEALAFRLFVVSFHYRTPLKFTERSMPSVKRAFGRLLDAVVRLQEWEQDSEAEDDFAVLEKVTQLRKQYKEGMDDDLNTAIAAAVLFDAVKLVEDSHILSRSDARFVRKFFDEIDEVFAVIEPAFPLWQEIAKRPLTAEESTMYEKMKEARVAGKYQSADALRSELAQRGIEVRNVPGDTDWRRYPWAS